MHLEIQTQDWIVYGIVSLTAIRLFFPLWSVFREFTQSSSGAQREDFGCYTQTCGSCEVKSSSKGNDPVLH
ncbi:hypothetical protein EHQ12_09585 [Leptospira gomenensis]|uniref:Uncharacterized protein n=1 Tax=Leptospira gomenensis TaxID=2484974 RepID=A0A5F1YFF5_9LEPT|nr:hypothetical protein [Leptospira gomenensis]TGK38505.1 hypothetical protein EHQ17_01650 [Leptospira gomenensis]TGK39331.1 hypothetical protein EHQ12_09585 [Leptospira gomenensis]TGK52263.1 hypothetical protein EHQ07_01070 [Leptospira gomenensis]TGK63008.1 hypothetical protein EHQ13_07915 [Leptospira gomenensis]